jgi:hypothetical protein
METKEIERPEGLTDEHLEWLDFLRLTGSINMFGASPHLAKAFDLDREAASAYTVYWMKTFGDRHKED